MCINTKNNSWLDIAKDQELQILTKILVEIEVSQMQIQVYVRSGLNSHYFHIIGDGHRPKSVGAYRAPL